METIKRHPLIIITILAALLRLPTIGIESMWYDETFSVWLARLPLANLLSATAGDVHPPLWYVIEWAVGAVFGYSAIAMRLVSALAGIALVPAVYRLALSFDFDRRRALAAAALTAIAPFMVYYSQEARAYSLIFLLTTLATIAVLERRYWLLIITASAALYLHNLTCLYIAALAWLALYHRNGSPERYKVLVSFAAIGAIWAPWVVWGLSGQVSDVSGGFWIRPPTIGTPIFIMVNWVFSTAAYMFVLVTVPLLAFGLLRRPNIQIAALVVIPMGLCIIAGAIMHPILVDRVIGSSAIPLYLLIAPRLVLPLPEKTNFYLSKYAMPVMMAAILIVFYAAYWGTDKVGRYDYDGNMARFKIMADPATDGIYHANVATYIIEQYYLPEFDQVVWRKANDLSQSLTDQTKTAMLMRQDRFENVMCSHERWWIFFYENPTTGDGERMEISRLVKKYNGKLIEVMAKNKFVYSRIYLLEDVCQHYAAR